MVFKKKKKKRRKGEVMVIMDCPWREVGITEGQRKPEGNTILSWSILVSSKLQNIVCEVACAWQRGGLAYKFVKVLGYGTL